MKISVIIPVVQVRYATALITRILFNSLHPHQVIVIDVSEGGFSCPGQVYMGLNVKYIRIPPRRIHPYFMPGLGTNEAWRLGFENLARGTELVSVFNDDILIGSDFFQILSNTFMKAPGKYQMAVPQTVGRVEAVYEKVSTSPNYAPTKKRIGYAYTLTKKILDEMIPIPESLKIFYGDNWIMTQIHRLGYRIMLMKNNRIFHYGGTSMKQVKESMKIHEGKSFGKGYRRKEYDQYLREVRALKGRKTS